MDYIKIANGEIAHLHFRGNYIGAIVGESTIEISKLFYLDFMIKVNNVSLFVDEIILKDIKDIDNIKSSYEIEYGNLKVGN